MNATNDETLKLLIDKMTPQAAERLAHVIVANSFCKAHGTPQAFDIAKPNDAIVPMLENLTVGNEYKVAGIGASLSEIYDSVKAAGDPE